MLNFYAEHHGKGRCDGSFALQCCWIADYARRQSISCLADMKAALEAGAKETMSLDPPPSGPSYYIRDYVPDKKAVCSKLDASGTDLQIEYTYCIQLERRPDGQVRGLNFCFSDRSHDPNLGQSFGLAACVESPATAEWWISYRKEAPEKTPLNVTLLSRRLAKQEMFMRGTQYAACSRRDTFLQALVRREQQAASSKSKYTRRKRVLAVNIAEASGSDSDSSSSS